MKDKAAKVDIVERIFASLVLTASIVLTVVVLPLYLTVRAGHVGSVELYQYYTHWLFITVVVVISIIGLIVPPAKSFKILGHLWYTEKPHNDHLTLLLWLILIFVGVVAYVSI